jgi:hypothetical protein
MTTVYWTPTSAEIKSIEKTNEFSEEVQILFTEPRPLMNLIAKEYSENIFLKCPAFIQSCKNTFVITAPMDGTIIVDKDKNELLCKGFGWDQNFYDSFCLIRPDNTVTLAPRYIFYSKESLEMESMPVFLLKSPSIENLQTITGSFDIGKWIRPVDFTFVVKDYTKPIIINRGDPIFFVRFKCNEKITLERVEYTNNLQKAYYACASLKSRIPNLNLPVLYEMAKSYVNLFLKRK